jgi:hypothetical protein
MSGAAGIPAVHGGEEVKGAGSLLGEGLEPGLMVLGRPRPER